MLIFAQGVEWDTILSLSPEIFAVTEWESTQVPMVERAAERSLLAV